MIALFVGQYWAGYSISPISTINTLFPFWKETFQAISLIFAIINLLYVQFGES